MIKTICVPLPGRSYKILIGQKILGHLPSLLKEQQIGQDACVITTPPIWALHGKKLKDQLAKHCTSVLVLTVPDSEESKNATTAFRLIGKIMAFDKKKKTFLVAFGGGVVGDLTGFIAAIYKRGIPYIQVPTTLLAQIDSSIGGKTAIDTTSGKNLIGAFYQPRFVLADASLLKTLKNSQLIAGLAEMVKYALIQDPPLYRYLKKHLPKILKKDPAALGFSIPRCVSIKAHVVGRDEFDKKGIRMILNFGHTVGHAVEAASRFRISHGEAVAIGMACACRLSVLLGLLKESTFREILDLLKSAGLPTKAKNIKKDAVLKTLAYDKKFLGKTNRFVLLERIGATRILENIPQDMIERAINETLT